MIEELKNITEIKQDELTVNYNTYRLHGICKCMIFPRTENELITVIKILNDYKVKWFTIGNGSNIILDENYDGIIVNLKYLNKYEINENTLYVQSGCMINKLSNKLVKLGYKGLDFAVGIPGTIGGSVHGNAGCYGSSISEVLISARIFDGENIIELSNDELKFNYRYSILKENNWVVLSCLFKIEETDKDELRKIVNERIEKRIATQDLSHPSNGSVFRNPEGYSAGKLIDDLGLKATSVNDAMISNKHANFIINNANATSKDIIELINIIKEKVKEEYNIDLVLEQEIIK